jgi:Ala-tRNA(Pro) deacylase
MSLVAEYLTRRGVAFEVVPHRRVYTSVEEAVALGVPADEVVKTVALRVHGKYALAVLPASRRLDIHLVRHAVGDPAARLATEAELLADFPGYELGALPPLGSLLGLPMYVAPEVLEPRRVTFADGTETASITAAGEDLFRDEPMTVHLLTRQDAGAGEERLTP